MNDAQNKATFPGYYDSLGKIAEFIRHASQQAGFDDQTIYQIELAVDEAVTNIIEHAYGGEGVGEVVCSYQINDDGLTICLEDKGQPFFPDEIEKPDIHAPIENRPNNGLGLFLIQKIMDHVSFNFSKISGNCLTMVKYKDK